MQNAMVLHCLRNYFDEYTGFLLWDTNPELQFRQARISKSVFVSVPHHKQFYSQTGPASLFAGKFAIDAHLTVSEQLQPGQQCVCVCACVSLSVCLSHIAYHNFALCHHVMSLTFYLPFLTILIT